MAVLAQLADPDRYRACDWDLKQDAVGRQRWDALFRWHLDAVLVPLIREEYARATDAQIETFRLAYLALFDDVATRPDAYDHIDVLFYDEVRARLMAEHGFLDPFHGVKRREDEIALALLPEILAEIDTAEPATRQDLLAAGMMAGNIFDLGAVATIERHQNGMTAFRDTRAAQPPRPWFRDDVDAWWLRWSLPPKYEHAVLFVDNAGSDIVLGNLPLVRWMLGMGTRVTLAANSGPALNDITAAELTPIINRAAEICEILGRARRDDRLRVIPTGSAAPLLDLSALDPAFVDATRDADLIMLHGMGRSIESNWYATFACDTLRTAVLKDEAVVERHGAKLFDCVFRFTPAGEWDTPHHCSSCCCGRKYGH